MLNWFVRRATILLIISCLWLPLTRQCFAAPILAQEQKSDAQGKKSNSNGKGSAKSSAPAKPVEKSSEADKLSNERMSTRGLHKGKSDQAGKQEEPSKSKPDASSKPDSAK
jgi:hypothetical protein